MKIERIRYEACPLCGHDKFGVISLDDCTRHPLYVAPLDARISWMACEACQHVFTGGYWPPDAVSILCRKSLPHQRVGHQYELIGRPTAARIIERVLAMTQDPPLSWLDVGFGDAALLLTAKEYGLNAVGIDIRQENVAAARALGLEAYQADIVHFKSVSAGLFDVVSLCDVLEHVPFPAKALGVAHALMTTGGILCVATPNRDTTVWRLLDQAQANPYWSEIEHYHCFSREGLYALLRNNGFEPVKYGISERYRCGMEVLARTV